MARNFSVRWLAPNLESRRAFAILSRLWRDRRFSSFSVQGLGIRIDTSPGPS